jgi:siroheme synthase-like protein
MAELVIQGRDVLIVGGGQVAGRKANELLLCGARVHIVAPALTSPQLARCASAGTVRHTPARFDEALLHQPPQPWLVFAATDDPVLNCAIAGLCHERGLFCNSVDDPQASGFLVPATVRRGPVTIGIGTEGNSPALSRILKQHLDAWLEPGWATLAMLFGTMRDRIRQQCPRPQTRHTFWRTLAQRVLEQRQYRHIDHQDWFEQELARYPWEQHTSIETRTAPPAAHPPTTPLEPLTPR